jgi:hypothetical protein
MLGFTRVCAKLQHKSIGKPDTLHNISVTNNDTMLGMPATKLLN